MAGKSDQAFRTIGELAGELGVPQHILRYWETRFPQLRPLQRAGNRRYYRPEDVALARRIHRLLNQEGYTIRGVQRVLGEKNAAEAAKASVAPEPPLARPVPPLPGASSGAPDLRRLRALLAQALTEAGPAA
jgi:DNA-binding transcriptional MerR regulator